MNNLKASLIATCTTLLPLTAGYAAFDPAIVPADSQWVIYLNFNTLRESELGRNLIEALPVEELAGGGDSVRPNIPKILETAGAITAFGREFPKDPNAVNGALILQGTQELRTIVEGFLAQMSVTHPEQVGDVDNLPFEAYQISGPEGAGNQQVIVALPEEPIVVVSKSREELLNTLEVYRKKAPSMRSARSPLAALVPQAGTYYIIAASNVPSASMFPANAPQSRILQMAESVSFAVGEEADSVAARLQLNAASDDLADKLEKIVNGIVAMISLAETSDERLSELIQSFNIERDGRSLRLRVAYPTIRVLQMVDNVLNPPPPPPSQSEPFSPPGRELDRWIADQDPGDDATAPENFLTRTIENVRLEPGSIIVLSGERNGGENLRFDYVEMVPVAGGAPIRLEAEFMRLQNYRIERVAHASGGEVVIIDGNRANARTRWNGAPGEYTLHVGYVDESDGHCTFAVSLIDPEPEPTADTN